MAHFQNFRMKRHLNSNFLFVFLLARSAAFAALEDRNKITQTSQPLIQHIKPKLCYRWSAAPFSEVQSGKDSEPLTWMEDETDGFQCLGHSNWIIFIHLSPFCSENFPTFSLSFWEANSYYPRGIIMEKEILTISKLDETEGFQCLRPSN